MHLQGHVLCPQELLQSFLHYFLSSSLLVRLLIRVISAELSREFHAPNQTTADTMPSFPFTAYLISRLLCLPHMLRPGAEKMRVTQQLLLSVYPELSAFQSKSPVICLRKPTLQ